jgi:L-alanine-DL-glutamate epimerase-like enolase superfamily enzyme
MRIVSVAARTVRWAIPAGGAARDRRERVAVLLEVRSDRGAIGLGEAAPLPGMSVDTVDDAERAFEALAARVPFHIPDRDGAFARADAAVLAHHGQYTPRGLVRATGLPAPAARFAIATALLDALARERGVSLADLLRPQLATTASRAGVRAPGPSPAPRQPAATTAHVGAPGVSSAPREHAATTVATAHVGAADSSARTHARPIALAAVVDDPEDARRALAAGIRCFKIKVGEPGDLDRVRAIAAAAPGATLRLDANRSWPRTEVGARLAALAALPIEYIEEPCIDAHQLLSAALPFPIALDESLATLSPDELDAALASSHLAAVVLKPTLLGGLSAALALAERARRAGAAAIASHTLEGPIGTAACAELALALGGEHAVGLAPHPGLAGWRLDIDQLAADHLRAASAPGLGFAMLDLDAAIRACSAALDGEAH